MSLNSLPAIENEIRRIIDLQNQHQELAQAAQANEETFGDVALESEEKTYQFTLIFKELEKLFTLFVTMHAARCLRPASLASLQLHFRFHLDAETKNTQIYKGAVALEDHHDTEYHRQEDLLSNMELHHAALLAIRNDLRLREQGAQNTPLQDINLNV